MDNGHVMNVFSKISQNIGRFGQIYGLKFANIFLNSLFLNLNNKYVFPHTKQNNFISQYIRTITVAKNYCITFEGRPPFVHLPSSKYVRLKRPKQIRLKKRNQSYLTILLRCCKHCIDISGASKHAHLCNNPRFYYG